MDKDSILPENHILKPAEDMKKAAEDIKAKEVNIEERIEKQLKRIAKYINGAANRGEMNTSIILYNELHNKDEIYNKILKNLLAKGYDAKLSSSEFDVIKISWE